MSVSIKNGRYSLSRAQEKEIRDRLKYNPETGDMVWVGINKKHTRLTGRSAGSLRFDKREITPRVKIKIFGTSFSGSRVAFFLMTGRWPALVDHINGDTHDDRWINLREATPTQNNWNAKLEIRKKSGLHRGIRIMPSGRFQARIAVNKTTVYLGTFKTSTAATAAYINAKNEMHGEYARRHDATKFR